eukprot:CAMPEP_0194241040 /NCGR_PEP_ID=MMETSP0158-20130606/7023_1 /TAXON_ID=33649 /ORGANISM="Thalassionema nitzschioides, Strain L26-B" /LENGTH=1876 /DNA_ID=CAMNT_0038975861 /DNA_START=361 /DNA_END=5991 /DNA_ORIENTATION=+
MSSEHVITKCPECDRDVGSLQDLKESQPLALRVLGRMRVKCPYRDRCGGCRWEGDYSKLQHHQRLTHRRARSGGAKSKNSVTSSGSVENSSRGPSIMTSQGSLSSNLTNDDKSEKHRRFTPPLQLTVKVSQDELEQQRLRREELEQQQQQLQNTNTTTTINNTNVNNNNNPGMLLPVVPEEVSSSNSSSNTNNNERGAVMMSTAESLEQEAAEPSKQPTDHHSHHERTALPPENIGTTNQQQELPHHHLQQQQQQQQQLPLQQVESVGVSSSAHTHRSSSGGSTHNFSAHTPFDDLESIGMSSAASARNNFAVNDFEKVHELTDDSESIELDDADLHAFLRKAQDDQMKRESPMNLSGMSDATDVASNVDSRIDRGANTTNTHTNNNALSNQLPVKSFHTNTTTTTTASNNNNSNSMSLSSFEWDGQSIASSITDPEYRSYTQPLATVADRDDISAMMSVVDENAPLEHSSSSLSRDDRSRSPPSSSSLHHDESNYNNNNNSNINNTNPRNSDNNNNNNTNNRGVQQQQQDPRNMVRGGDAPGAGRRQQSGGGGGGGRRTGRGGRGRGRGRGRGNNANTNNSSSEGMQQQQQQRGERRPNTNSQQQQQQQHPDARLNNHQEQQHYNRRSRSFSPIGERRTSLQQQQQHSITRQQQQQQREGDFTYTGEKESSRNWNMMEDVETNNNNNNSKHQQQQQQPQRRRNSFNQEQQDNNTMREQQQQQQQQRRRHSFQEQQDNMMREQQQQQQQMRVSQHSSSSVVSEQNTHHQGGSSINSAAGNTYADEDDSRAWGMDDDTFSRVSSMMGDLSSGANTATSSQAGLDSFLKSTGSNDKSSRKIKARYNILGLTEEESLNSDNTYHRLMKMQQENDKGACEGSLLHLVKALKHSASKALDRGDYAHAIDGFSKAIKALPDPTLDSFLYATLQTKCAEAHLCMNEYSQCIRYADEALEIDERIPEAYLHKANAHLAMGKFEDAAVILTIGSKRVEHSEFFEKNLDHARQLIETMKALECLKTAGLHSELIKASDSLDDSLISNKHILLVRARAFLSLDQIDNAIGEATQIISMDSRNIEALIILTKSYYLGGNIDNALIECQKALAVDEKEATELYDTIRDVAQSLILTERAIQNGHFKQACTLSSQTIYAAEPLAKSSPLFRKLYLARSEANLYAENYSAAISNANAVLESLPESLDAWSIKIKSMEAQGSHTQLAEELNVVISTNNGEWGAGQKLLVEAFDRATQSAAASASQQQQNDTTKNKMGDHNNNNNNTSGDNNSNNTQDNNHHPNSEHHHQGSSTSEHHHHHNAMMEGGNQHGSDDILSDSYDILGVRRDESSLEEIFEIYQSKVRKYSEEELIKNGFTDTERGEALEKLKLLQDSMVIVLSDQRSRLWDQGGGSDAMVRMADYLKDIATAAFDDKNFKSAAQGFAEAITALADPTLDSAMYQELHIKCAEAHLEIREFSKCIRFLDEALEVDDQIPEAYLFKARAHMHMNRFDDATIILEIGYKRCPSSKELQKQLEYTKQLSETIVALDCLKINGLHSELIKVTDTLGEEMMSEKHILLARAGAFLALDQSAEAVEAAAKIHEIDASDMEALVILAKANYLEGNIEDALIECQKALSLGDKSQGVNMLYGMINDVAQALILAERALQNQNYKEACTLCTKTIHIAEPLLKSSPLYRKLYLARSEANCHAGNYMQSVANANLVLGSLPESLDAWSIKIKSLEALGKHYQLVDELEKVVSGDEWGSRQPFLVETYNRATSVIKQQEAELDDHDHDIPVMNNPTASTNNNTTDNEEKEQEQQEGADGGQSPNYYDLLGVAEDTPIEEIKEIIRTKAKEVSIPGDCTEAERAEAEEKLKRLQECLVFFLTEASSVA